MKQWIVKLVEQLDIGFIKPDTSEPAKSLPTISEDKATLLYMIDVYNKNLFEVEKHSIRKVREKLDCLSKALIEDNPKKMEKTLFDIRQFFSSYRIDEYSYIQNTFDDFKRIVWDFADQLSEDIEFENSKDKTLASQLQDLKEAVEANSIESLRLRSREFINSYMQYQSQKNEMRQKRMVSVKKNLETIKKQLVVANTNLARDHLTSAHNRKSCDEYINKLIQLSPISQSPTSLILMDIDFFKKINDSYGHDIGDYVLKECVRILQEVFNREGEMVARIGGEEFVVILPTHSLELAVQRADIVQKRIREESFIQDKFEIRFTVSMGIAQLIESESAADWLKRADTALYQSKNSGRNKYTIASNSIKVIKVA
ncbi:MAG: diguanylate cyclase [Bdellovibrionales bacterium RIFCSPHIGHO2_01_FULL_40_29]|nr:MAG: diguanylate cyclase [Bdellovibrionales bacterium RIFCSPHIGHO2_01_FULL_40_29]OFZ33710.1 MAG: diguanylate cyclase [Bdellovibrionales bacterium RIFCSPHIGHO2_02_FULL_40_15]